MKKARSVCCVLHIQALKLNCSSNYLVGSADEVQVMAVKELTDHICSKGEGDPTVILSPALYILIWI